MEGGLHEAQRVRHAPSTSLRLVHLPVPGRITHATDIIPSRLVSITP